MKQIIFFSLFIITLSINAQPMAIEGKTAYNFWIQLPKQDTLESKSPVLIFLHGKSLSGKDLNRVKRYGVLKAIEKGLEVPAIVIAPQLPSGPWIPEKINEVLEYVTAHYQVDSSRIYVAGMSLGSYGTMSFLGKYPDKIAAAVSICGGGEVKDACHLATVPIAVYHGDKDFIVPVSESRKIVEAIRNCDKNAPIDFHILKGENHGTIENLFRKKDIYEWMFKHHKSIQPQS